MSSTQPSQNMLPPDFKLQVETIVNQSALLAIYLDADMDSSGLQESLVYNVAGTTYADAIVRRLALLIMEKSDDLFLLERLRIGYMNDPINAFKIASMQSLISYVEGILKHKYPWRFSPAGVQPWTR